MRHYLVAVLSENFCKVDKLLEKYYEGRTVEPYISKTAKEVKEYLDSIRYEAEHDSKSYVYMLQHEKGIDFIGMTDDELKAYWCEGDKFDEEGNIISTHNPDSKWDYYQIGGRWNNMLLTKSGERVNFAKIKDIDWEKMKEENIKHFSNLYDEAQKETVDGLSCLYTE